MVGFGEHKRDHLITWDLVCKAKGQGRLWFGGIAKGFL